MRVVFMGTPEFAVPTLRALVAAGHEVVAAYTQPPRPAGRGKQDRKSAVQLAAEALGIAVRHPASLKGAVDQAEFTALSADVAVVAAYGLILPQAVLDAPRLGCLNVHASLLPRWRGAAPIQRAILAGDEVTGVCIMQMEAGLDTGPLLDEARVKIGLKTAGELFNELSALGAARMAAVLEMLPAFPPWPQDNFGVTYAQKFGKSEAHLDLSKTAVDVGRQIRAFSPTPGAWFQFQDERVKVLKSYVFSHLEWTDGRELKPGLVLGDALTICCGQGLIRPDTVQRAGRPVMSAWAMLQGFPIPDGSKLS